MHFVFVQALRFIFFLCGGIDLLNECMFFNSVCVCVVYNVHDLFFVGIINFLLDFRDVDILF